MISLIVAVLLLVATAAAIGTMILAITTTVVTTSCILGCGCDSTAEVAVLAASKLAETTVCSDKTKTAPFPLGLQQREGRCDHYGLDCSQYEYSCYDYDCKHSVTVAAELQPRN